MTESGRFDGIALEVELSRRNIPFVKFGGLKFLEASHVKDFLAILRWAQNGGDRIAGFRALQLVPGVGPAKAARMLEAVAGELGLGDLARGGVDAPLDDAPEVLAAQAAADAAAARAAAALGLDPLPAGEPVVDEASAREPPRLAAPEGSAITLTDRLRLVLGRKREELGARSRPMALALDELYGRGRGEGSRGELGAGFEPMFVPQGQQQTYGEMEPAARGAINHRAAAFRLLAHRLGDAPPVVGSPSPGAG